MAFDSQQAHENSFLWQAGRSHLMGLCLLPSRAPTLLWLSL